MSILALNAIPVFHFYTAGPFPSLCPHSAPWCLSVLVAATGSAEAHSPGAAPFPLSQLSGERTSGRHPSIRQAARILHFVMLAGGFELVDGVKETVDNSLQLK